MWGDLGFPIKVLRVAEAVTIERRLNGPIVSFSSADQQLFKTLFKR